MSIKPEKRITYLIRAVLAFAAVYFLLLFGADVITSGFEQTISSYGEILFLTILTLLLTFSFDYLENKHSVFIPHIISTTSVVFIFCAIYLGSAADFYNAFWWWDDMLHMLSGTILGLVGFVLIYYLNSRFSMRLSPIFVALFALTFAVFMGVIWEIFEFTMDAISGSNTQRWAEPANGFLIGKDYQCWGLRDTMSDLIVDIFGGILASSYAFYLFKNENKRSLKMMRDTFGDSKKNHSAK